MPIQRRRLLRALASGGVLVALALTNGASEPMAGAQARTFAIHDIQGAAAQSP